VPCDISGIRVSRTIQHFRFCKICANEEVHEYVILIVPSEYNIYKNHGILLRITRSFFQLNIWCRWMSVISV